MKCRKSTAGKGINKKKNGLQALTCTVEIETAGKVLSMPKKKKKRTPGISGYAIKVNPCFSLLDRLHREPYISSLIDL